MFAGLLHLITRLSAGPAVLTDLVQWELALLAELGYGLDLERCALTGARTAWPGCRPAPGAP